MTSGVQRSSEVMPANNPRLAKQSSKDSNDGSVSSEGSKWVASSNPQTRIFLTYSVCIYSKSFGCYLNLITSISDSAILFIAFQPFPNDWKSQNLLNAITSISNTYTVKREFSSVLKYFQFSYSIHIFLLVI